MFASLEDVTCARVPWESLTALAELRCHSDIEVIPDGAHAWLQWPAEDTDVLKHVLPLPGVELFVRRENWYRLGQRLPCPGPPAVAGRRLDQILIPAPIQGIAPPAEEVQSCLLRLVREPKSRPATAMECALTALCQWADTATTAQIAALHGARCNDRVFLLGSRLPLLPDGERYWGQTVLAPLGFRVQPALAEPALREALGLADGDMAVLRHEGLEVIPHAAFQPLTRASIRRAGAEGQA